MERFSPKGFEANAAEEIARSAGVSRGTFFRPCPAGGIRVFFRQGRCPERFRRMLHETRSGETPSGAVRRPLWSPASELIGSRADPREQPRINRRPAPGQGT